MQRYLPSFRKLSSLRMLTGAFLLALSPLASQAQTTYATSQNFENANAGGNLRFMPTGGGYFSGTSTGQYSQATPANSPLNTTPTPNSSQSYGVANNNSADGGLQTATLDFSNVQLKNSPSATLDFRLAVFSIGNDGGLTYRKNTPGSIGVSISTNNGASYTDVLSVRGTTSGNGAFYDFSSIVSRSTSFSNPTNPQIYSAGDKVSTISVNVSNLSQVKVRITLIATAQTAIVVDDVRIFSSSPLPVELTRFTATAQAQSVGVSWTTASEKNNDYFEVQRSTNTETFSAIGKIKGEGTSSNTTTYAFTDRAPVAGRSYYRLRQIDLDGTESFSPVVSVNWSNKLEASFYPNPSHSTVTLTGATGPLQYQIYSLAGQHLTSGEAQGGSTVDLSRLPAGVYMLELRGAGKRSVQRIVRQ